MIWYLEEKRASVVFCYYNYIRVLSSHNISFITYNGIRESCENAFVEFIVRVFVGTHKRKYEFIFYMNTTALVAVLRNKDGLPDTYFVTAANKLLIKISFVRNQKQNLTHQEELDINTPNLGAMKAM